MTATSRRKGQTGEREVVRIISELTSWDVARKVRQHGGDDDIGGVPGWCVEVKRHKAATRSDVRTWWEQAVEQADRAKLLPVLFYRRDRDEWRAVWPLSVVLGVPMAGGWLKYTLTCETSIDAWAAVAREVENMTMEAAHA